MKSDVFLPSDAAITSCCRGDRGLQRLALFLHSGRSMKTNLSFLAVLALFGISCAGAELQQDDGDKGQSLSLVTDAGTLGKPCVAQCDGTSNCDPGQYCPDSCLTCPCSDFCRDLPNSGTLGKACVAQCDGTSNCDPGQYCPDSCLTCPCSDFCRAIPSSGTLGKPCVAQ